MQDIPPPWYRRTVTKVVGIIVFLASLFGMLSDGFQVSDRILNLKNNKQENLKDWHSPDRNISAIDPSKIKFEEYYNDRFGFIVKYPTNWEKSTAPENNDGRIFSVPFDTITYFIASGSIFHFSTDTKLTYEEYENFYKNNLEELVELMTYEDLFKEDSHEIIEKQVFAQITEGINQELTYGRIVTYYTEEEKIYVNMRVFTVYEGIVYSLYFYTSKENFEKYKYVFLYIVKTFKII